MMRECLLGSRVLRCVGRAYGIEGRRALRGLSSYASYRSTDPPSHRRRCRRRLHHRHHRRRGDDANEILAVTDGVVDAVRDAGRYASAAFAGARLMLAERGMRRLEAEGESVRRERMVRRGEERARRRRGRPSGGDVGEGGDVEANDDDGTPLFSSDGEGRLEVSSFVGRRGCHERKEDQRVGREERMNRSGRVKYHLPCHL